MACSVKILKVSGEITSANPDKPDCILVTGTARGCQKVMVNSEFSDPDGIIVPVDYMENQDEGSWTATLDVIESANCVCGMDIRVRAIASPYNPDCQGVNIFTGKLDCQEK